MVRDENGVDLGSGPIKPLSGRHFREALSPADQTTFNELTLSGTMIRMRSGDELADDKNSFVTAAVLETISG